MPLEGLEAPLSTRPAGAERLWFLLQQSLNLRDTSPGLIHRFKIKLKRKSPDPDSDVRVLHIWKDDVKISRLRTGFFIL